MNSKELKIGDKVTYTTPSISKYRPKMEYIGIVKSIPDNERFAFVVYHCDNNWDKYFNYTAILTRTDRLKYGWHNGNDYA